MIKIYNSNNINFNGFVKIQPFEEQQIAYKIQNHQTNNTRFY